MPICVRRSAISVEHPTLKEMSFPCFFDQTARTSIDETLRFGSVINRLSFYYKKDSNSRIWGQPKHDNSHSQASFIVEMTFSYIPDLELQEAESKLKSKIDSGDAIIIRDTDSVMIAQQMLIERSAPDYYVRVNEGWSPNFDDRELMKRLHDKWGPNCENQKPGDVARLPSSDRIETLSIIGRAIDNSHPKMSKIYEIIRERRNDESSKILELKEIKCMILGADSALDYPR